MNTKLRRKNADTTRNKILRAALSLFYEKGYAGTSLGSIAKLAQVNQSLIAHHFGNKQRLFQAVKMSIIPLEKLPPINPKPTSLRDFLQQAIQQRLSLYEQSPNLFRLVAWEKLESSETREQIIGTPTSSVDPMQWLPAINYLQAQHKINQSLSPNLIHVWILYSVNAILVNDFGFFAKDSPEYFSYVEMIVDGLTKALAS